MPTESYNPSLHAPSERERIASALEYLHPDCDYETWFRIVLCVGDAGYPDLVDAWSARGTKHRSGDTYAAKRRRGDTHPNPVTLGTLYAWATENGWEAPPPATSLVLPDPTTIAANENKPPRNWRWVLPEDLIDIPEPEPLVPGMLYRGALHILAGASGDGKSTLLAHIIAKNEWLGQTCGIDFAWHMTEESEYTLKALYRRVGMPIDHSPHFRVAWGMKEAQYQWSDFCAELYEQYHARKRKPDLIVIDTLLHWGFNGEDSNDASAVRGVLEPVAQVAKALPGVATVLTHHTRKNARGGFDDVLGSGQFRAATDQRILLKQYSGHSALWTSGRLQPETQSWAFTFATTDDGVTYTQRAGGNEDRATERSDKLEKIADYINHQAGSGGVTAAQLSKIFEVRDVTMRRYLKELVDAGDVARVQEGNAMRYYAA